MDPQKDFSKIYKQLIRLISDIEALNDNIKSHIDTQRQKNILLLGNPYLPMKNQLLEIEYSLRQHKLNFKVYLDLIIEAEVVEDSLLLQLKHLIYCTEEYFTKFEDFNKKLISLETKTQSKNEEPVIKKKASLKIVLG